MKLFNLILNLLFPPKCVFCQKLLKDGEDGVCESCKTSLPYTEDSEVFVSGEFFETCAAPFFYRDKVRDAVLRYKFSGNEAYCKVFGKYVTRCVMQNLSDYDLISWVPVSDKRKRQRGYDQGYLLAKTVAEELGTTAIQTLKKTVHNKAQSSIDSKEERKANVLGIYTITDMAAINGKSVLLIDDVITTGATLSECSRCLVTFGAEKVQCAVFARR